MRAFVTFLLVSVLFAVVVSMSSLSLILSNRAFEGTQQANYNKMLILLGFSINFGIFIILENERYSNK